MAKYARWRDCTKLSKAGLLLPKFRLSLPFGDLVIEHRTGLPIGTPIKPYDLRIQCSILGVRDLPLKSTDPIQAQKESIETLKKRIQDLMKMCEEDLAALDGMPPDNYAVADPSVFDVHLDSLDKNSSNDDTTPRRDETTSVKKRNPRSKEPKTDTIPEPNIHVQSVRQNPKKDKALASSTPKRKRGRPPKNKQ